MNTLQTPLILVITSLGQLQVLSWFLFWFEVQFPGTWILHIGRRRMRPPTTFKLQMDLDPTPGTSLLLKPNLKPEYGNNSIFYPGSNQCCALLWIYKELQFWVLISFQTQRTAGSGSLEKKKSESKNCQPWLFQTPLKTLKEPTIFIKEPALNWHFCGQISDFSRFLRIGSLSF